MSKSRPYFSIILCILIPFSLSAQYYGGDGDGSVLGGLNTSMNEQVFYCNGGGNDGYSLNGINSLMNDQTVYCSGGDEDGFSMVQIFTGINDQNLYCQGSDGDGIDMASVITPVNIQSFYCQGNFRDGYDLGEVSQTMNVQYIYCDGSSGDGYDMDYYAGLTYGEALFANGGNGDGFSLSDHTGSIFGLSIFAYGGSGDGYGLDGVGGIIAYFLGVGQWTGLTNNDWNNNTNWLHDVIPGQGHNVIIPDGCPNYPVITSTLGVDTTQGSLHCRGLEIETNATFTTDAPIYDNGEVLIAGVYTATMNANNANRIYKHGSMTIPATGTAIFGNETTMWGTTDLVVYSGGILEIEGGTLEVDDQLHVYSGGTLSMNAGEIFVHKFGNGTTYLSSNPGNFYVESGALGGISGGILKICGRESSGSYYALNILEPSFDFSGTSLVKFQHGDYGTHYNIGIYTVDGVLFQNMTIDKPGNTIFLRSNIHITEDLIIETGATFEAETGHTVEIGP